MHVETLHGMANTLVLVEDAFFIEAVQITLELHASTALLHLQTVQLSARFRFTLLVCLQLFDFSREVRFFLWKFTPCLLLILLVGTIVRLACLVITSVIRPVMCLGFLHVLFNLSAALGQQLAIPIQLYRCRHFRWLVKFTLLGWDIIGMNWKASRFFSSLLHLLVSSADAVRNLALNS